MQLHIETIDLEKTYAYSCQAIIWNFESYQHTFTSILVIHVLDNDITV